MARRLDGATAPGARIPRRLLVWVALLCAALAVNGLVSYYNISRLVQAEYRVTHTLEVRQILSNIDSALGRAVSSERGFAITGDDTFFTQHARAVQDLSVSTSAARTLTKDSATQQQRIEALDVAVRHALAWFADVINTRKAQGRSAALARIETGIGATHVASVRAVLESMHNEEDASLSARNADARANLYATVGSLAVLTVMSIWLALLLVRAMRREVARRDEAQQSLFAAKQMLRLVLDTIPQRVFWKDRASRYLGGNDLFAHDAGVQFADAVIGKHDAELSGAAYSDLYRRDDEAVLAGAAKLNHEVQVITADGRTAWLDASKVPLRDAQGEIIGVLGTYQDITARKAVQAQLEREANFDSLTALPNRRLLTDRINQEIARAKRDGAVFAVAVVDLDRFKHANDGDGHAIGDHLLVAVAQRLQALVRAEDTVARFGGDEFVLVLPCRDDERFVSVVERVLLAIEKPFTIDGRQFFITCSIGVSTFPQDGLDAATLLSHADAAMYRAKEGGRNRFEVFEAEMGNRIRERIQLERGLRSALKNAELFLHYQPQLNLHTNRVEGVEALVRWNNPPHGLIPPLRFIPVAEQSGLIVPVGAWILRAACSEARKWEIAFGARITVAVNLSALQFRQKGFTNMVARTLSETQLAPSQLELEITETLLVSEAEDALSVLTELKAMGICLSIDDFGTGYSSLSYLRRLPVDKLKIDASFVRDTPADANAVAITRAIVSLARSLDLRVIAEGVESEQQCEFLRGLGCDEIQGYYFSRPVPSEAIGDFLAPTVVARAR